MTSKRISALLLLGMTSFFVIASLFGAWLRPPLDEHNVLHAKIELALRYPETNMVAIGPSYVEMGFNPEIFDAEMKANHIESRSLNMGMNSLSVVEMRFVIQRLVEKLCCIKYFIILPCYECLSVAANPDSQRSISYLDWRHGLTFLNYILQYDVMPPDGVSKKTTLVRNVVSSIFRHYTNLGLAADYFGLSSFASGERRLTPEMWMRLGPRGYSPAEPRWNQDEVRDYENSLPGYRRDRAALVLEKQLRPDNTPRIVTDTMFDILIEQVRFLRGKGVKVLVATPPNDWAWPFHAALVAKLRTRCQDDVPFVDFGDSEKWPELFLPPDVRLNSAHLSSKGAALWSKALADQFSTFVSATVAALPNHSICAQN